MDEPNSTSDPDLVVIWQHPYRVQEVRSQVIEAEVAQMLHNSIVEESTSPNSSPTVVVAKPNGSQWLYYYFWKLNKVSEFDRYPMP